MIFNDSNCYKIKQELYKRINTQVKVPYKIRITPSGVLIVIKGRLRIFSKYIEINLINAATFIIDKTLHSTLTSNSRKVATQINDPDFFEKITSFIVNELS